jgi:hypothetical protein
MSRFVPRLVSLVTAGLLAVAGAAVAAWKTHPSGFAVATRDHMIAPELQFAMAQRIGVQVTTLPTSHVSLEVEPAKVAAVNPAAVAHAR